MKQLFTTLVVIAFAMLACKKDKKGTASIVTTAPTNVTPFSLTTGGNITNDGGSAITKRGVCWATHTAPTVADSITNDGTGSGSFSSNISGLLGNVTYYIRAYAINASGTAYGDELNVTTSKGMPTVTTAAITNSIALSATSGGNVLSDGGYPVTARGVVWSLSPHPTTGNFLTNDGTGTGAFTSTLTPLASQKVYYVRAYATNSVGTSYGNEIQFTAASSNSVADYDGNVYGTVTIGTQVWMTSNLKVTHYRNGDTITLAKAGFDWTHTTTGAYVYPNADSTKNADYGKLYSLAAVLDSRNIAPPGWHIPSDAEWQTLEIYEGMTASQANSTGDRGTIGAKLYVGGSSGLNLQNVGYTFKGSPYGFNQYGGYWTSTTFSTGGTLPSLYDRWINDVSGNPGPVGRFYDASEYAEAIRCVKD